MTSYKSSNKLIFKSISDLTFDIYTKLIPILPRDIGVVLGVPRSGMLPASIISTAIGVPLGMLGGEAKSGARMKHNVLPKNKKILLVDDSIHTGKAINSAKKIVKQYRTEFYTCAIYAYPNSVQHINFYAELHTCNRLFQWNFSGVKATEQFSWDLDGVICTDPKVYDNDGDEYMNEIVNGVQPYILPQVKIHSIITNRISRWEEQTKIWLKNQGVKYDNLIMQPYSTAVERRQLSTPEEFKSFHFKNSNSTLFIESNDKQAKKIAELSKKPVLSIEKMKLYDTI